MSYYGQNPYDIGFSNDGNATANLEIEFVNPEYLEVPEFQATEADREDAMDGDEVEIKIDLYVSGWENSYYRGSERDFCAEGVTVEAFGREYHFELDEVLAEVGVEEFKFMSELERQYDDYADDCRAEMYS